MASRFRSASNTAFNLFKSAIPRQPTSKRAPSPRLSASSSLSPRNLCKLGSLQSLIPLHSAVSSSRLISCIGVDSRCSRSLSQGMLCCANPGV
ncbi:hypothetical protein Dimus_010517 [Dionaea muscipula]